MLPTSKLFSSVKQFAVKMVLCAFYDVLVQMVRDAPGPACSFCYGAWIVFADVLYNGSCKLFLVLAETCTATATQFTRTSSCVSSLLR